MTNPTLESIERQIHDSAQSFVSLSNEEIDTLTDTDIEYLQRVHGQSVLLKLPPREQEFFQWLKENDPAVWDDLWADDTELLVGLSFIKDFKKGNRGFVICELESSPNYFFSEKLITPKGLKEIPYILNKAQSGEALSTGEALLFEIMISPIDIWRFCFKYNLPLQRGRETIQDLETMGVLVHLPLRDDLIKYIEM